MSTTGPERGVLVTGGSGYIGSHVVRALVDAGRLVTIVDTAEPPPSLLDSVRYVACDVRDRECVRRVLASRPTAVLHFAGLKSVSESWRDAALYLDVNVGGTVNVLTAMAEAGVHHFVFSSSAAVYGAAGDPPVAESSPVAPLNPYGHSKAIAEQAIGTLAEVAGIRSVTLRYFNAAGASDDAVLGEDWTDAANLIPVVMQAALGVRPFVDVFGTDWPTPDGTAIRDYIHVLDLVDVHLRALGYLEHGGESQVLNVGTGQGASVHDVLRATGQILRRPVPARLSGRRLGDPAAIWADVGRARDVLGWSATRDLDAMLRSAYFWHARSLFGGPAPR